MKDYWAFKAVHESFVQKTCGEVLRCPLGGLYRRDRGKLLVIVPPDKWDFSALFGIIGDFPAELIRSYGYTDIPSNLVSYSAPKCYFTVDWVPTKHGAYALRRGLRECSVRVMDDRTGLPALVSEWAQWAAARHDMVVKGHYLRMIADGRFTFLGFYRGGALVGAMAYTTEGTEAAVSFTKLLPQGWWFSPFMWTYTIQHLASLGYISVNCGDTADQLKQSVGLVPIKQRRLYYSKKGLYR